MGTLIKIPDTSGLVTTTVLNTKIGEVENKIPVVRGLVKKTDYDAKIKDIKKKCFTIFDHKKFTIETLDAKIKQKELVNKSEISSLIEKSYLNTEFATLSTKVELKGDEDKIMKVKVQEFDSQNRFVYQATLDTSGLKIGKSTDFVLSWISNEIHTSKINPLYTTFLHRIKLSGYRVWIKFDEFPLAVEQNNWITKIVHVYTVYDLDTCPRSSTNNFKLKYCLFGATYIVKKTKIKKAGWWFAKNAVTFVVNKRSSCRAENRKNNFLVLGERPVFRH